MRTPGILDGLRSVVWGMDQAPHKLAGAPSSVADCADKCWSGADCSGFTMLLPTSQSPGGCPLKAVISLPHGMVTTLNRSIFTQWAVPYVGLFASEKNHKLMVFSMCPSLSSSRINALLLNWIGNRTHQSILS